MLINFVNPLRGNCYKLTINESLKVSHASSSPDLDNRERYPLLFRVHPSEKVTNIARVALLKRFGWTRAALLYTADGSFNTVSFFVVKVS